MDDVFWMQAYGDREEALALAQGDEAARRYIDINYGPWDPRSHRPRQERPQLSQCPGHEGGPGYGWPFRQFAMDISR